MLGQRRWAIEDRFADYLVKAGGDECWNWTGPITKKGYPTLSSGGKGATQMSAPIAVYRLAFGIVPEREIKTTCDNKCCLNPRHLVLAGGAKSKATI